MAPEETVLLPTPEAEDAPSIALPGDARDYRTEDKLWRLHHARAAAERIAALTPTCAVRIPRYGEIFRL